MSVTSQPDLAAELADVLVQVRVRLPQGLVDVLQETSLGRLLKALRLPEYPNQGAKANLVARCGREV